MALGKLESDLVKEVEEYLKKVTELEAKIREKQAEHEAERIKPLKLRKRKLSEINHEIQELSNIIWRSKPKKKCSNCNRELNYDDILCWHCGEVFLDICPKCKSLNVNKNEWGLTRCLECNFEYRELDLLEDLLIGGAEPNREYKRVIDSRSLGLNCYNIGIKKNTIWEICKEYNCHLEKTCEYFCPAFLSLLALVWRGKVSTGLPWGYDQGNDLHGYKIRWKRPRWQKE